MENLIKREINSDALVELLIEISTALDQCVDYGTEVIEAIIEKPRNDYVDSSIGLLLRDYLELLDGVSQLIRSGSAEAAIPICRSMFEYFLSILYIIDRHEADRAISYQVSHIKNRLKSYNKVSPGHREQFNRMLKNNGYDFIIPEIDYSEEINRLTDLLNREPYKRINEEWRLTEKKVRKASWYSLFNGPKTIRELAVRLNKEVEYEILYRVWSLKTHANSAIQSALKDGIKIIRHPENVQTVSTWAFTWTLFLFETILNKYHKRKRKDYAYFYLHNIKKTYNKVTMFRDLIKINYN